MKTDSPSTVQTDRSRRTPTAMPHPLAWFRIGLSAALLMQALSLTGHLRDLHGRRGIVEWTVMSEDMIPGVPTLAWVDSTLKLTGASPSWSVPVAFAVYVAALAGLLLGCRTRLCAILAWLTHTMLLTSGEMSNYGVDRFTQIGLFYCVCFPVGHAVSLDALPKPGFLKKPGFSPRQPSFEAWLGLRVLQAHVCIAYTASGIEKALGDDWWNGEAVWRALMSPHDGSGPIDFSFLATVPWLAQGLCWLTLLLEGGMIAFVWNRHSRMVWLVGIVGMHLSIAVLMNLWIFSAAMIAFDISAFGIPHRERTLESQISRLDLAADLPDSYPSEEIPCHPPEPTLSRS